MSPSGGPKAAGGTWIKTAKIRWETEKSVSKVWFHISMLMPQLEGCVLYRAVTRGTTRFAGDVPPPTSVTTDFTAL